MKKLLLSTAILAASTLTASAQDLFRGEAAPDELRASDLMGMRVYASEAAVEGDEIEGLQEGWEDIGEINDMVLSRDGSVEAVLVDVGGFLGIGERQVAVSMDQIRMVSDSATADDASDYFLVINADRAAIEGAPDYMALGAAGAGAAAATAGQADAVADASAEAGAAGTEPTDEVTTETADAGATEMDASETAENAVEETGEEVADGAAEVGDEVADAGEEVAEEAGQVGMTDTQEDVAEATDTQADATEEATEETAQAGTEAADEQADTTEAMAEGNTESETEAMDTAEAATGDAAATDVASTDAAATDEALAGAGTDMAADGAARTPTTREGYAALGADQMTADNLEGAAVYDANDERVGEVGELLIDDQGMITDVVLDIGGFLGIGEKPVALPMDSLDILQQEGGDDLRIYVSQSREELEAMETYSEAQ